jgi:hypothetical protein
MPKFAAPLLSGLLLLPASIFAQDVIVTRNFTGLWTQPEHESQGINLQIIDQADGSKVGVAYWYTYGADRSSAWFLAVSNQVIGNRIVMDLYEGDDIGFLEDDQDGDDRVQIVGEMEMEFSSCDAGTVTFDTEVSGVGSGTFPVARISDLFNTSCSGGISDDTPADVLPTEQRIGLAPAREGITGSGHADFEVRADRTEFSVEAEGIADGTYLILVGGVYRADLVVSMGIGETEFRSPVEAGKILLSFDPRDQLIEVHDAMGEVLTSGNDTIGGGDDGTGGGGDIDWGTVEIEVELDNPGVYALASGRARLEPRADRTDFSVEIEDVPVGSYAVRIGGVVVGSIQVQQLADGSVEGEIEFRNPVEPGKVLLDFDPRGQQIDVLEGSTVVMETLFPQG